MAKLERFFDSFTDIKGIFQSFWFLLTTEMTDFPTLLYTWSLKNVPLQGETFLCRPLRGVHPWEITLLQI